MSNIIDKIQLSGITYDIGGQGGSGVSVIEVSQAEYDALPSSAKTDTSKMYVITDAQAGDLTNYYTKTETNTLLGGKADTATTYTKSEVDTALSGKADTATTYTKTEVDNAITAATATKQDTLVSGTNIKTINNESILGSGNIDIQGGGISSAECQTMIDNSISGKADSDDVYTTGQTSGATELATAFAATQPKLSAGTGISIDANNVISATGGGGGGSYTPGDGIDITNNVISVTGKADTSAVTAIQDSLSGYVTTNTNQDITSKKTFIWGNSNDKPIVFKQLYDNTKLGFQCKNSADTNNELATFEFRPNTFTIDGVQHPLLYFGHYRNKTVANAGVPQTVIGFRQYDQKNGAAYHYLMPLPEKAKTPFSLTTTFKDYYAPMGFKVDSGGTMVTTDNTGVVDLSSYLGGGGGGKAIEAGRGISITTGATADTVSFNLPISAGTGNGALIIASDTYNLSNKASGNYSVALNGGDYHPTYAKGTCSVAEGMDTYAYQSGCHAEGHATKAGNPSDVYGMYAHAEGNETSATSQSSHAEGYGTIASGNYSHAEGNHTKTTNESEHASGQYNVSNTGSTDADKTLFSVGNGTADNARHNAFEIRQNGDIYLSSGGTDIKLQDHLGGGGASYSAGTGIDITNNVISVTGKVDTSTYTAYTASTDAALASKVDTSAYNTYTAATDTALASKQTTLTAGTGISIIDNVISATGGGGGKAIEAGTNISITTGETVDTINCTLPIKTNAWNSLTFNTSRNPSQVLYASAFGDYTTASGKGSFAIGKDTTASGEYSFVGGRNSSQAKGSNSFSFGDGTVTNKESSVAFGQTVTTNNAYEFSCGKLNKSVSASTTFGNSGNTLFSVGNGTSTYHNAFEIRQNGDIYYFDGTNDVKLQDKLSSLDTTIGNINTILESI